MKNDNEREIETLRLQISDYENEIKNMLNSRDHGYSPADDDDYLEHKSSFDYQINELDQKKLKAQRDLDDLIFIQSIDDRNLEYRKTLTNYKEGDLITDNATESDLLNRSNYASRIAEYIMSRNTNTPFNFGIFGCWGEGKSSFLKMIQSTIIIKNTNIKTTSEYLTHIVNYDATEYNAKNQIWACILRCLFEKFEQENKFNRLTYSFVRLKFEIKQNMWRYIIRFISLALLGIWGFIIGQVDLSNVSSVMAITGFGIIPIAMLFVNILLPFIKGNVNISKTLADKVILSMENPNYNEILGLKENIKKDLMILLESWLNKSSRKCNERIVLFIDEVDRCSSKGIIELLEALQLFLSIEQIIVVLSVDVNVLCNALTNSGAIKCDKDERINLKECLNYLEKYITIPFYINHDNEYNHYIYSLLSEFNDSKITENIDSNESEKSSGHTDNEELDQEKQSLYVLEFEEIEELNAFINTVNEFKHITPRTVKRLINMLIFAKDLYIKVNENYSRKYLFVNFINWFLFSYFNPITSYNIYLSLINSDYSVSMKCKDCLDLNKEASVEFEDLAKVLIDKIEDLHVDEIKKFSFISSLFIPNYNFLLNYSNQVSTPKVKNKRIDYNII